MSKNKKNDVFWMMVIVVVTLVACLVINKQMAERKERIEAEQSAKNADVIRFLNSDY